MVTQTNTWISFSDSVKIKNTALTSQQTAPHGSSVARYHDFIKIVTCSGSSLTNGTEGESSTQ